MKILAYVRDYLPKHAAGGQVYLHRYLKAMQDKGHEVTVLGEGLQAKYDGIQMVKKVHATDYDVMVTQLRKTGTAINTCRKLDMPLVYISHNSFTCGNIVDHDWVGVVHNSKWTQSELPYKNPQVVCRPFPDKAAIQKPRGNKITLINVSEDKGGDMLKKLAKRTDYNYIAVKGSYKDQVSDFPANVYVCKNTDNLNEIWEQTRILLMPSNYESYGLVGVEATERCIPVIAKPQPGIKEALGDTAEYAENDIEFIGKIAKVWEKRPLKEIKKRRKELREQKKKDIDKFEQFLIKMSNI